MSLRIVQLGTSRHAREGVRIGTVRRPPRGVPKARFAADNWYDTWLPELSPSAELVKLALHASNEREWARFVTHFRAEMKAAPAAHALDLLAALSHTTNLSIGCYCEDESRCHRSVLRALLTERGADIA
ncbi:MAG: DUF488 family protein [Gemmatimonadaceae bacterium]|nr:DUF488 family protein [Gemmatimonadaceae bacterium]